jgi:HK97 gp10 family phage protein
MSAFMQSTGFDQVTKDLEAAISRLDAATTAAALEVAEMMIDRAKELVSAQGESQPGAPPKNLTGELLASMTAKPGDVPGSASAVAGAFYAKHLEYGTRKMQPHPFMQPASQDIFKDGRKVMKSAADKALGASS